MRKKIADINEHEFLRTEIQKTDELADYLIERHTFLQKQINALLSEEKQMKKAFWEKIEGYLEAHKLFPPDYEEELWNLAVDSELGIVFCEERKEKKKELLDLMKRLTEE